MKDYQIHIVVLLTTVLLAICAVMISGTMLNARSASLTLMSHTGKRLSEKLKATDSLPSDSNTLFNYNNSTDYLISLFKKNDIEDVKELLNVSARIGERKSFGHPRLTADNNIWIVIKNLPDNAPDNLVVMATRNIDATTLRTKLLKEDMEKKLKFTQEKQKGMLKKWAVLIYYNGRIEYIRCDKQPTVQWQNLSFSRHGNFMPFDLTVINNNQSKVKYLTPNSEVTPSNF